MTRNVTHITKPSSNREISLRHAGIFGFSGVLIALSLYLFPFGQSIQNRISRPVDFSVRTMLGRDPELDSHLKIYALGDSSLEYLQGEDMPLKKWAKVFARLDKEKVRVAIVDKLFGTPQGIDYAPQFVSELKKLKLRTIAGAFLSPGLIPHRPPLTLAGERFELSRFTDSSDVKASLLPESLSIAYGPHPKIVDAFSAIGHLLYTNEAFSNLGFRLPEDRVLFASPLLVSNRVRIQKDGLFVNDTSVPLDSQGRVLVDLPKPESITKKMVSFASLVKASEDPSVTLSLPVDSVVVILTSHFTGNQQMLSTPRGVQPAGLLTVAMINSVLTGKWLVPLSWGWLLIILTGILGAFGGSFLKGTRFWLFLFATNVAVLTTGFFSFSYFRIELPWTFEALSLTLNSLGLYLYRAMLSEKRTRKLREAFEGSVPKETLDQLLQNPTSSWLEPTGRIVSVMFIDIVGFSSVVERQTPHQVFSELKAMLGRFTETIHEFGGVVDKTLGDGVLCFFGLEETNSFANQNHAERAIRCAAKIQQSNAAENISAHAKAAAVYPLRIGINTTAAYIGDIGNHQRIDLTLIGNGVNFAKRLESAAEPYSIMIGSATKEMILDPALLGVRFERRWIAIKHFSNLVEATEVDAFPFNKSLRKNALDAYRKFAQLNREEKRLACEVGTINVQVGNDVVGSLVDLSENGMKILLNRFIGKGVYLECTFDSQNGKLKKELEALHLNPIRCEVRWGETVGLCEYLHGVQLQGLTPDRRRQLFKLLIDQFPQNLAQTPEKVTVVRNIKYRMQR